MNLPAPPFENACPPSYRLSGSNMGKFNGLLRQGHLLKAEKKHWKN
jgi:hypothetical protein